MGFTPPKDQSYDFQDYPRWPQWLRNVLANGELKLRVWLWSAEGPGGGMRLVRYCDSELSGNSRQLVLHWLSAVSLLTVVGDQEVNLVRWVMDRCKAETVKKPFHVNMNRDIKMIPRKYELELPVSPHCIPSKLCLDDAENNIHYQKLDSKEELGQVQLSQVKNSYSMFEPQFNRVDNCNFAPPSFSAELSSHRHIPKQNLIPRIASSPQKLACERKHNEQLNNVNCSDSLISKINGSQDDLSSSYKLAQFGTLFERLNSLGNGNFLSKRSAIMMSQDFGNVDKRRQSDLVIEKQSVQQIWEESEKEVSSFLENMNQPTHTLLSENCDSFVHQNMINLLDIDQQKIKKTFDKCGYDSSGDICLVTSSNENHPTHGNRSIFIVPESTSSSFTFNKTSYPEKYQSTRNYQKKHNNNEVNDFAVSFEKDCYPINSERKDLDSSQSSQSTSYSPRPTDSCFSSSSEVQAVDAVEEFFRRAKGKDQTLSHISADDKKNVGEGRKRVSWGSAERGSKPPLKRAQEQSSQKQDQPPKDEKDLTIPESSTMMGMMAGPMTTFKWQPTASEPVKDADPHFHHFLLSQTENPAVCYQAITKKLKICEEETGSTSIQAADSTAAMNGTIIHGQKEDFWALA
ncbi:hypothetical protein SUZIE_209015 [Sciurus carolinensis]|uniref:Uncharacterized protein n=1 Tax=Sciurus carolinensis TaxID=30640 RepID=A0AA41NIW9_SCICA|nr:hypothetical protein [Sciurus carolinensis]